MPKIGELPAIEIFENRRLLNFVLRLLAQNDQKSRRLSTLIPKRNIKFEITTADVKYCVNAVNSRPMIRTKCSYRCIYCHFVHFAFSKRDIRSQKGYR